MALVAVPGRLFVHPLVPSDLSMPLRFEVASPTIDATGEKIAVVGRVYWADGGTHDIDIIGWLAGTIVSAGGSGITISLQDVDTATGVPSRPDGVQDQTVGVVLSDLTADGWNENTLSSGRASVANGTPLCVVWEFDGGGRLGSDSLEINMVDSVLPRPSQGSLISTYTSAIWAGQQGFPDLVIRDSVDGAVGTVGFCLPYSAINTHSIDTGTTPDEIANQLQYPYPITLAGVDVLLNIEASDSDVDIILYSGTTPIETLAVDEDVGPTAYLGEMRWRTFMFSTPRDLAANTLYRAAIKPTTANNVSVMSVDVNQASYLDLIAGQNFHYWDRVDAGAWDNETTTRWVVMRLLISKVDDGAAKAYGFVG